MKRWLSYILMAVLCGLYLSSCAKDEEVAKATDGGKVPVRLTLAFSNFGGRAASEPGDLDYTTVEQSAMTADDVYVLVVDANDNFLYQVQDLKLGNPVEGDNYYTRQLEGTMLRTVGGEQVKLVVLANLKDNKRLIRPERLYVIFWKQRKEVISPKFIKNWFIIMVDLRYLGNLQKELSRCGEAAI